ncbi:MAG: phosphoglycolate phosphatase [Sphingomonadales bacterium]|jgi:phosphoglycolate phosphatase|nr:phosphoglycolate phosphatase [Sphingomonadales bacterium]
MPGLPFDVIVFDLDGTLADTAADLAVALNHVLVRLGRPEVPAEDLRHLVGHGARALLRRGLAASGDAPEELVEAGFPLFIEHYAANICHGTRPYPGVESALDALRESGAKLAVCTNKAERLTHLLLDALGWHDRFDAVVGGDTLAVRKPDTAPLIEAVARAGGGRAAFVGDSITDADTARAARLPFVAVSFGFSDRPVEALGADAAIDRYDDLRFALDRLAAGQAALR